MVQITDTTTTQGGDVRVTGGVARHISVSLDLGNWASEADICINHVDRATQVKNTTQPDNNEDYASFLAPKQTRDTKSNTNSGGKASLFSRIRRASVSSSQTDTANEWYMNETETKLVNEREENFQEDQSYNNSSTQPQSVDGWSLPPPPELNFTSRENHHIINSANTHVNVQDQRHTTQISPVYAKNPLMYRWAIGTLCARLQNNHKIVMWSNMFKLKEWAKHVVRVGGTRTCMRRARSPVRRPSLAASRPKSSPVSPQFQMTIPHFGHDNRRSSEESEAVIWRLKQRLEQLWGKHVRTAYRFGRDKLIAVIERQLAISFRVAFLRWRLISKTSNTHTGARSYETTSLKIQSPKRSKQLRYMSSISGASLVQPSAVLERQAHAQTHVRLGRTQMYMGMLAAFDALKRHRLEKKLKDQSRVHAAQISAVVRELRVVHARLQKLNESKSDVQPMAQPKLVVEGPANDEIAMHIRELRDVLKRTIG